MNFISTSELPDFASRAPYCRVCPATRRGNEEAHKLEAAIAISNLKLWITHWLTGGGARRCIASKKAHKLEAASLRLYPWVLPSDLAPLKLSFSFSSLLNAFNFGMKSVLLISPDYDWGHNLTKFCPTSLVISQFHVNPVYGLQRWEKITSWKSPTTMLCDGNFRIIMTILLWRIFNLLLVESDRTVFWDLDELGLFGMFVCFVILN